MNAVIVIGGISVTRNGPALQWTGPLAVDDDGDPDASAPAGVPHNDALANAGHPGNWWGIATDNGRHDGEPIVQGPDDPMPGAYVSETALADPSKAIGNPARYVDAQTIPYISVPPELLHALGVRKGDVALVARGPVTAAAVVGDVGPRGKLGEGSPALCRLLGINPDPRLGGAPGGVSVTLWPGSTRGWPRTVEDVADQVRGLSTIVPG